MTRRRSESTDADEENSRRRSSREDTSSRNRTRNTDPSPYVAPHDGMGVYDDGERDTATLSGTRRRTDRTESTDGVDTLSGGVANGLLQRRTKDERPTEITDGTDVPEPVREVLSSSGRPLGGPIKRDIEEKMGESFGDVRIHTEGKAAQACAAINARAFTAGNHIVFNSGEYDPTTPHGKYVLAHEMAHVKQQTGGALSLLPQADSELVIDPDPQLEREADEAAKEALSKEGDNPRVQRLPETSTEVHVQRLPEEKVFHALALFKDENESGNVGEFQQTQNQNRIGFLQSVVSDMLDRETLEGAKEWQEERIEEAKLDAKTAEAYPSVDDDEVIEDVDESRTKEQVQKRPAKLKEGKANIESTIQDLTSGINDKLEQIGLTDDQRQKLSSFDGGEFLAELGWTTVKGVLSLVPSIGPAMAAVEIAETTLREFWDQTSGSLAERLNQVKEAVVEQFDTGDYPGEK